MNIKTENDRDLIIQGLKTRINRTLALEEMHRAQGNFLECSAQIFKRIALRGQIIESLRAPLE